MSTHSFISSSSSSPAPASVPVSASTQQTSILPSQQNLHRLPSQSLSQLLNKQSTGSAISTSITTFDNALDGGFQPGQIYEVCGLNGSGKSSLATELCLNCLKNGKKVLWISTLQSIPLERVKSSSQKRPELLKNLDTIRLTTLGSLFLFLQSLSVQVTKYSLLIIDDFSTCITRCFDENEQSINSSRPKNKQISLESKKNRSIQSILKILSTYCATYKCSCVLFNSSDILNMSFVEIQKTSSQSQQQELQYPSSQPFSSQNFTSKPSNPKRFYQQVLVSPLGDHPFWSSYFNSRIMLYRDWSSSALASYSGQATSIFVHLRQNSLLKRQNSQTNSNKPTEVITFQETDNGITEILKDDLSMVTNTSHSFTLEEEDFTSGEEGEGEAEEEEEPGIDEPRTTDMNLPPILLDSSPRHRNISTAKNFLPDELTKELEKDRESQANLSDYDNIDQGQNREEVEEMEEMEEEEGGSGEQQDQLEIEDAASITHANQEVKIPENNEQQIEEEEQYKDENSEKELGQEVHEEATKEEMANGGRVQESKENNEIEDSHAGSAAHCIEREVDNDIGESTAHERHDRSIVQLNAQEFEDNGLSTKRQVSSNEMCEVVNKDQTILDVPSQVNVQMNDELEEPHVSEMIQDISVEEEIGDELEELYPTQPESLSVIQLSQLPEPEPRSKRCSSTLVNKYVKRLRGFPINNDSTIESPYDCQQDSSDSQLPSDEYIPASAPYF